MFSIYCRLLGGYIAMGFETRKEAELWRAQRYIDHPEERGYQSIVTADPS